MFNFIEYIPKGYKNAITTTNLLIKGRFKNARSMQKSIEAARSQGFVIASKCDDGGGYYLPETPQELRSFIRTLENRAEGTLKAIEGAKKMLAEMESTN